MQSKGGRWRGLSCLVKLGDMGRKVWRGVQKRAGQVQLQCLQAESGLPALLQLLPPDAQLEEKPFCTDTALLCTGVGSPLIFVSVSLFFFPPGANYYLAEMYFLLEKGGLGLFFGVFSVCFFFVCVFLLLLYFFFFQFTQTFLLRTDLDLDFCTLQGFFKTWWRLFLLLYMFSCCPLHNIFSSNLERCKE